MPRYNSYCGDSLLDDPFSEIEKFDYVAGNPPYVSFQKTGKLSKEYKAKLKEKFIFYHHRGDLLNLFFELGLNRSKFVGLVTSRYWMETKALEIMRRETKNRLCEINESESECESRFDIATVQTANFIFNNNDNINLIYNSLQLEKCHLDDKTGWFFSNDLTTSKLLKQKKLGEYCTLQNGIETGNNKFFVTEEKTKKKVVYGENVRRWSVNNINKYLKDEDKDHKYTNNRIKNWKNKEGILARNHMSLSYFGFAKNIDTFGMHGNVSLLIPIERRNLHCILACLNSKVMQFWFKKKVKRVFARYVLGPGHYKSLPMPKELDPRLDGLVDKMLEDPNDKETEKEINKIVYELYELAEEEIKIIEEEESLGAKV